MSEPRMGDKLGPGLIDYLTRLDMTSVKFTLSTEVHYIVLEILT